MERFTLDKKEKLCSDLQIRNLFANGQGFFSYPIRTVFLRRNDNEPARFLISVPKKKFKHAVDRNNIKRKLREAYRTNKLKMPYDLAFLYISEKNEPFYNIEKAIKKTVGHILNLDIKKSSNSR